MTRTEIQTTGVATVTTECSDSEIRGVLRVIRQNGGFILGSGPTSTGFKVIHTEYKD